MQKTGRAIQLIAIDPVSKSIVSTLILELSLCEEAQQVILSFTQKYRNFAVVVVVGKYRTGKSYLINQVLLNQQSGFDVGSTINACTKGLWMWSELIQFESQKQKEPIPVLLIDTEGIGSVEEDVNHDMKVFLLAMLISSCFIYNSVGTIDDMALQNLGLIVNLTKMLQKGDERAQKDLFASFPHFLWILRDFTLRLEDEFGNKINPKEYLETALKPLKGFSETIENKNKIRRHITQFFQERDCMTLVRPTQDESDIQQLNKIPMSELRPEFQEQVSTLRKKLAYKIQLKQYKGKATTPFSFLEMCKYFVEVINEGNLPVIESQWSMIQSRELENHIDIQNKFYSSEIQQFLESEQPSQDKLEQLNLVLIKRIKLYLEDNSEKEIFQKRWKQIKKELNRIYEDGCKRLQDQLYVQLEQLKNHYCDEINKYDNKDFWGIVDIANEAVSQFWQNQMNPNEFSGFAINIWEHTIARIQNEFHIVKNLSSLHVQIQSQQQIEIRRLQDEIETIQQSQLEELQQNNRNTDKFKLEIDRLIRINEQLIIDIQQNKNELEQKDKESKQQIKSLQLNQKQETQKLRDQMSQLEERLINSNIEIDKLMNIYEKMEQFHQQDKIIHSEEIERLNDIIENYNRQLYDFKENQSLLQQPDEQQCRSARKSKSNVEFIAKISNKCDTAISDWRIQKEFLKKQLHEVHNSINKQKSYNDAILNNLKQL